MTDSDRDQVIGHAKDHVAYGWSCSGPPVRHDRRGWTEEELALYRETVNDSRKQQRAGTYIEEPRLGKVLWSVAHRTGRFDCGVH